MLRLGVDKLQSCTRLKHVANENMPSSHKQLRMLTNNIENCRLNMIIRVYSETIVVVTIYFFGCQNFKGGDRLLRPKPL